MIELKQHIIPNDHLIKICKYRQGESCCKYIMFSPVVSNFICVKLNENMRKISDGTEMRARGDNCSGI